MLVTTEFANIPTPGASMRTFLAAPKDPGSYPAILCYSDIFQLTGSMLRFCVRLAGYGFVAVAPEIFCRIEPPGTAIPFDDRGRTRGLDDAAKTPVVHFDQDCRAALTWITSHSKVSHGKIGAVGFCIGGHLAFRAAFQPDVLATVCNYGTGIHNGKLGLDSDAGSLARAKEIRGQLLLIFGTQDSHVPEQGRQTIDRELRRAGVQSTTLLYPAEHAFMRDESPRFDPRATDLAFAEMIRFFSKSFPE
jgi:carboxymethylenebutenolidase